MADFSSVTISAGDKEPIVSFATSSLGAPATGKTDIKIVIRRDSDGFYYDWSDDTFKTFASVVQLKETLSEVNATASPGEYFLNTVNHSGGFDTSVITNPSLSNDIYFVTADQDPGTDLVGYPQLGEIRVRTVDIETVDENPIVF